MVTIAPSIHKVPKSFHQRIIMKPEIMKEKKISILINSKSEPNLDFARHIMCIFLKGRRVRRHLRPKELKWAAY